jgi:type IV secretion system protein VirD4
MNKAGKIVVVSLLALIAGLYLSGYFFLFFNHQNPIQTTPLTILQYSYHYGDNHALRKSLIGSSASGFGIILIFAILPLIPRGRALHGDAKFATSLEIKKRGLLNGDGILLGQLNGKYLSMPGQQGVILSAPPQIGQRCWRSCTQPA